MAKSRKLNLSIFFLLFIVSILMQVVIVPVLWEMIFADGHTLVQSSVFAALFALYALTYYGMIKISRFSRLTTGLLIAIPLIMFFNGSVSEIGAHFDSIDPSNGVIIEFLSYLRLTFGMVINLLCFVLFFKLCKTVYFHFKAAS